MQDYTVYGSVIRHKYSLYLCSFAGDILTYVRYAHCMMYWIFWLFSSAS